MLLMSPHFVAAFAALSFIMITWSVKFAAAAAPAPKLSRGSGANMHVAVQPTNLTAAAGSESCTQTSMSYVSCQNYFGRRHCVTMTYPQVTWFDPDDVAISRLGCADWFDVVPDGPFPDAITSSCISSYIGEECSNSPRVPTFQCAPTWPMCEALKLTNPTDAARLNLTSAPDPDRRSTTLTLSCADPGMCMAGLSGGITSKSCSCLPDALQTKQKDAAPSSSRSTLRLEEGHAAGAGPSESGTFHGLGNSSSNSSVLSWWAAGLGRWQSGWNSQAALLSDPRNSDGCLLPASDSADGSLQSCQAALDDLAANVSSMCVPRAAVCPALQDFPPLPVGYATSLNCQPGYTMMVEQESEYCCQPCSEEFYGCGPSDIQVEACHWSDGHELGCSSVAPFSCCGPLRHAVASMNCECHLKSDMCTSSYTCVASQGWNKQFELQPSDFALQCHAIQNYCGKPPGGKFPEVDDVAGKTALFENEVTFGVDESSYVIKSRGVSGGHPVGARIVVACFPGFVLDRPAGNRSQKLASMQMECAPNSQFDGKWLGSPATCVQDTVDKRATAVGLSASIASIAFMAMDAIVGKAGGGLGSSLMGGARPMHLHRASHVTTNLAWMNSRASPPMFDHFSSSMSWMSGNFRFTGVEDVADSVGGFLSEGDNDPDSEEGGDPEPIDGESIRPAMRSHRASTFHGNEHGPVTSRARRLLRNGSKQTAPNKRSSEHRRARGLRQLNSQLNSRALPRRGASYLDAFSSSELSVEPEIPECAGDGRGITRPSEPFRDITYEELGVSPYGATVVVIVVGCLLPFVSAFVGLCVLSPVVAVLQRCTGIVHPKLKEDSKWLVTVTFTLVVHSAAAFFPVTLLVVLSQLWPYSRGGTYVWFSLYIIPCLGMRLFYVTDAWMKLAKGERLEEDSPFTFLLGECKHDKRLFLVVQVLEWLELLWDPLVLMIFNSYPVWQRVALSVLPFAQTVCLVVWRPKDEHPHHAMTHGTACWWSPFRLVAANVSWFLNTNLGQAADSAITACMVLLTLALVEKPSECIEIEPSTLRVFVTWVVVLVTVGRYALFITSSMTSIAMKLLPKPPNAANGTEPHAAHSNKKPGSRAGAGAGAGTGPGSGTGSKAAKKPSQTPSRSGGARVGAGAASRTGTGNGEGKAKGPVPSAGASRPTKATSRTSASASASADRKNSRIGRAPNPRKSTGTGTGTRTGTGRAKVGLELESVDTRGLLAAEGGGIQ